MRNKFIKYFFFFLLATCLYSCKQNEIYYKFEPILHNEWSKNKEICFELDSLNVNRIDKYNINIELSHNVNYAYQSLWLYIDQTLQDSISVRDTLECILTDENGVWLGSGNGPLRHISFSYKTDLALDTAIQSKVCISHAMQDVKLKGVEKIGLKIY